jgi:hypothetical protein
MCEAWSEQERDRIPERELTAAAFPAAANTPPTRLRPSLLLGGQLFLLPEPSCASSTAAYLSRVSQPLPRRPRVL